MVLTGKRVAANPDVLTRELQGQLVLLNLESETYFGLDEVGTRMWSALTNAPSISAALDLLGAEYEAEPGELQADVRALVERLQEEGLVELVDI